jgi:hypothetical protein
VAKSAPSTPRGRRLRVHFDKQLEDVKIFSPEDEPLALSLSFGSMTDQRNRTRVDLLDRTSPHSLLRKPLNHRSPILRSPPSSPSRTPRTPSPPRHHKIVPRNSEPRQPFAHRISEFHHI